MDPPEGPERAKLCLPGGGCGGLFCGVRSQDPDLVGIELHRDIVSVGEQLDLSGFGDRLDLDVADPDLEARVASRVDVGEHGARDAVLAAFAQVDRFGADAEDRLSVGNQ